MVQNYYTINFNCSNTTVYITLFVYFHFWSVYDFDQNTPLENWTTKLFGTFDHNTFCHSSVLVYFQASSNQGTRVQKKSHRLENYM